LHQEPGVRGFSFDLEEAPRPAPNLGRLDLDWSDLGAPAPEPPSADAPAELEPEPAPRVLPSGSGTPLMPHAAALSRSGSAQAPAAPRPLLAALAPPVEARPDPPAIPVVRRLRFPSSTTPPIKQSPRPSTRFADSIGQRRALADSTSDLTLDLTSPPEDLPSREAEVPIRADEGWDEPGPPAVLLRRASALLSTAKETALDLGGRGLDSGRLIAGQMSDALRERLERRPSAPATPAAGPSQPRVTPSEQIPRDLPKRSFRAMGRRGAGPILALVAALGMFFGSRHLIGSSKVGLSKTTSAIPELGEVKGPAASARSSAPGVPGPGASAPVPSGPPPAMATELAPLPPGMAWPGKGLLEVVTSEDELVYVDGVFTGRGPLRRVPVTPGEHEVSIRKEGSMRQGTAKVEPGQTTRAIFRGK
jgi:hypothetical protein